MRLAGEMMFEKIKRIFNRSPSVAKLQLIQELGNGFYTWNGKVYQSDIVRACIRPKAKAVGKLVGKCIRSYADENGDRQIDVNNDIYIRRLLERPNPYMSAQKMQEKLCNQLALNNNAYALIMRDENGIARNIMPVSAASVEAKYDKQGNLSFKFYLLNGNNFEAPYSEVIHLRSDYCDNDIFGTPLAPVLAPLMNIVSTSDQSVINAIKNSAVIRWLLKVPQNLRPDDLKSYAEQFSGDYLSSENSTNVAVVDSKAEAQQVIPKDYVPNAAQSDRTKRRIQELLGTNDKIVNNSYTEDEWNSYYEGEIEPIALDLQNEYTEKILTPRQRALGSGIVFEAVNLACASISTKLSLVQMVDRGALTPNEWRATLNLAPLPGGDVPILRKDTGLMTGGENDGN